MPDAAPSPTEAHHLATFKSRGVAVPFTSPLLAGARVREVARTGIELLVPSPSGGRGVYVLNWPGVRALCHPTIHDTMLFRRFSSLAAIDPAHIRGAALEIACNGAAGREAAAAARASLGRDVTQRELAKFLLSMGVLAHTEPDGRMCRSLAERTPDIDRRADAALLRVAQSLGRPPGRLGDDLAEIADLFAPLGVAPDDVDALIPRVLGRLGDAQADLSRWLSADSDNDVSGLGEAIMVAMRRTCRSGQAVLAKIRAATVDPVALLRRWIRDQAGVVAMAARCGWLLDGWERLSLLWLSATGRAARRAALLEMGPILPVLPREVSTWTDTPIGAEALEPPWRVTSSEDSWRTGGAAFALVERNERLLAMSA